MNHIQCQSLDELNCLTSLPGSQCSTPAGQGSDFLLYPFLSFLISMIYVNWFPVAALFDYITCLRMFDMFVNDLFASKASPPTIQRCATGRRRHGDQGCQKRPSCSSCLKNSVVAFPLCNLEVQTYHDLPCSLPWCWGNAQQELGSWRASSPLSMWTSSVALSFSWWTLVCPLFFHFHCL